MSALPAFEGLVVRRGDSNYNEHRYQYAISSSTDADKEMAPAFILYPKGDNDVIKAVNYAKDKGIAVAVRTGGHQYGGASSTGGKNIQLDMSTTYLEFDYDQATGLVRTGISFALREFNAKLRELKLFMPHGQCSHVHVGGHVQTGGYGQLGRSFGLFGDHVVSFEIIVDSETGAKKIIVTETSNPDLFFAVLGGSPGNFGVLTHLTVKTYRDIDHPKSRGFKAVYLYNRRTLKNLLDVLVDMANDENCPGDFDYCITMVSGMQKFLDVFPNLDETMKKNHPEFFGQDEIPFWPPSIIVYAQWANLGGSAQNYDATFFNKIKDAPTVPPLAIAVDDDEVTPMSELTKHWIFQNVREFDLPFEKRTYLTNSKTLSQDRWSSWVSDRIDEIQTNVFNGCKLSVQIQNFGGKNSQFRLKGQDGKRSYNWREDTSIVCVLDCFYETSVFSRRNNAVQWQAVNDKQGIGQQGKFCKEDRRVHWGSYGDHNMGDVWRYYYDSPQKYERLCQIKKNVDPKGVFTPNSFCVGYLPSSSSTPPRALLRAARTEETKQPQPTKWNDEVMSQKLEQRTEILKQAKGLKPEITKGPANRKLPKFKSKL